MEVEEMVSLESENSENEESMHEDIETDWLELEAFLIK